MQRLDFLRGACNRQVNDSGCLVDMDGLLAAFMDYMFDTHFILLSSPLSRSISLAAMNNSDEHVRAQQDGHARRDRVRLRKLIADEQHGESQQREYRLGIQHDGEVSRFVELFSDAAVLNGDRRRDEEEDGEVKRVGDLPRPARGCAEGFDFDNVVVDIVVVVRLG